MNHEPYSSNCLSMVDFYLDEQIAKLGSKCQSPIELGLLRAMLTLRLFNRTYRIEGMDTGPIATEAEATIHIQYPIDQFRADFALELVMAGKTAWLVVECDGHDFHEKSKEQAARDKARDRHMTARGFRVVRFTGSEIYRDAMACAVQIHEIAAAVFRGFGE